MGSKSPSGSARSIQSVNTACSIIELLQEVDEAGITEVANHLDIAKSVAYNHLSTLYENGFVVREGDTYRLSLRFLNIGEGIRTKRTLYEKGKPKIEDMAEECGEFTHLMTEERGWGYTLHRAKGPKAVATTARIGKQNYLHRTAAGKAILAHIDINEVKEIINIRGLPAQTKNTITEPEELFTELETIRDKGVAVSDEECVKGARSVGAPITGPTDNILGAISISGPTARLNEERIENELSELVDKTANFIEITLSTQEASSFR